MKIVYNSYNGRYSDSPRALYEALAHRGNAHEHIWVRDPAFDARFPAGTAICEVDTPAGVEVLESADLVISDSHIEMDWTKRAGTRYLQTWHGTPLKRVHADILNGPPEVLARLSLDIDRWDLLLSPNRYTTEMLRGAFGWDGPVLETGYPRNDALRSPSATLIRQQVRRSLGIEDEQTVVLYTPTWRDDTFWAQGPDAAVRALEMPSFAGLGDDQVVLVRLHYKLPGRPRLAESSMIRNMSDYPDVAELYLAADVMVTDYSSTMFDFAVTGKPLLFYVYDLERYRDEVRGFYFDLSADPPGPLVRTPEDLVERLRDLDALRREYAEAYERFSRRFCSLEDGHATERVLDHLLSENEHELAP